jgi:hypothetical protein
VAEQNVTVQLYYGGVWNDVPVYVRDGIRITRGTTPESGDIIPATASLTLDNRTGVYDPANPLSPLYGKVGRNTPIRIGVDSDVRFTGEVVSWKPRRTVEDVDLVTQRGDAWTLVEAAGQLWRLGQGADVLRSPMYRALSKSGELVYVPLELDLAADTAGVQGGQIVASPVGPAVRQPLQLLTTDVIGTAALVDLQNGTRIDVPVPAHTLVPADGYQVEFMSRWQAAGFTGGLSVDAVRMQFAAAGSTGDTERVQVETDNTGEIFTFTTNQGGAFARDDAVDEGDVYDGATRHISVRVYQDGTDVVTEMYVNGVFRTVALLASSTLTTMTSISLNFVGELGTKIPAIGQVVVYQGEVIHATADAATGYAGELAADRFERLCDEEGIGCTIIGTAADSKPMGPQGLLTLLGQFGEIQRTDDGLVYDTREALGLTYRTGRSRINQTSVLDLTFPTHVAPPLDPAIDDLGTRNDVTAKSPTGSARSVEETGPMSVQAPPDGVGRTTTTVDVNPDDDASLPDIAGWNRAKGTVPDPRYPRVVVDLVATPGIETAVETADIGDLLTLAGLPRGTARLHVPGYTEDIGSHTRTVAFVTVPEGAYKVGVWTDDTPTQGEARWGARTTVLAEDLTTVETAVDIDTGTDIWATTASRPGLFPAGGGTGFNVTIGGLTYLCTAITGVHPNLTMTIVRLASDKTHSTGDQVWVTDTFRWG